MCPNGYHTGGIKEKVGKKKIANLAGVFYRREIRTVQGP